MCHSDWQRRDEELFFLIHFALIFAYKADIVDWTRWQIMNNQDKFDQIIVLNEEYPYSNCLKDNSRSFCLMNCFKSGFRISTYFFLLTRAARST